MAPRSTAADPAEAAAPAFPVGTLHGATFNFSYRLGAIGWDKIGQAYCGALIALSDALRLAGRSLDARVVNITAKLWRDRGGDIVASRHAEYVKARAALLAAVTTDPENVAGKVRLVAEMLGLPDPWCAWRDGLPPRGSREAEAFTPEAEALACVYRDLRACAREVEALRKRAAKRGKKG